jgi:hypothetical protein
MKKGYWALLFMILALGAVAFVGCGGDDDDDITNGGPVIGSFECDIGETHFEASYGATAARTDNPYGSGKIISAGGLGPYAGDTAVFAIGIIDPQTGTFSLGGLMNFTHFAGVQLAQAGTFYSTTYNSAHGSLTISEYTANKIVGTFNFSAYLTGETDSIVVTNGTFTLPVVDTQL